MSETADMTDVLIAICRRVLEANRHKFDGDSSIRGVTLTIKLSEKQQQPRTALLELSQETQLADFRVQPEIYTFPD